MMRVLLTTLFVLMAGMLLAAAAPVWAGEMEVRPAVLTLDENGDEGAVLLASGRHGGHGHGKFLHGGHRHFGHDRHFSSHRHHGKHFVPRLHQPHHRHHFGGHFGHFGHFDKRHHHPGVGIKVCVNTGSVFVCFRDQGHHRW